MEESVLKTPNMPSTATCSNMMNSTSCKRKLHYNHIWDKIDNLCCSSAHIRNSFGAVFGESTLDATYGSKARDEFDNDISSVIDQLERVCRLLQDDYVAQRDLTEVLYESSVAAHNESELSRLSDHGSFNESFDNINTSTSNLDISLNDTYQIEQHLHPAKRRRISFNNISCDNKTPDKQPAVRFTTPQPTKQHGTSDHGAVSIAKMALSEARKNGHKVTSLTDFIMIKPISAGAYGKVYLAKRRKTGDYFAIKIMKKEELIRKNMVDQVVTERDALALAKSPFIVKLFYSFQNKHEVYFVMEYLIGGDLCSFLSYVGCLDEDHAALYLAEIALALAYLHKHTIIHKDIKPENMLIDRAGHIKLTDFGLSSIRLQRKITISDLVYSPYNDCSPSQHWRTPGQLASLTSNLAFKSPGVCLPRHESTPTLDGDTTPITRKKRFIPKRCSFNGSNNRLSFNISSVSCSSPTRLDTSAVTHYRDAEISFGEHPQSETDNLDAKNVSKVFASDTQISKVIGTPDYIAPELLLHRAHTTAADWWSFGICMYELIVGLPPFHDNTVTDIFKNILNSEIEWPEDITKPAQNLILDLLKFEPADRVSFPEIKRSEFFKGIDWDNILKAEMPFIPKPENETDTGYFEGHNSAFNIRLSDFDGCVLEREDENMSDT